MDDFSLVPYTDRPAHRLRVPPWIFFILFWLLVWLVDINLSGQPVTLHSELTELGVTAFAASLCFSLSYSCRLLRKLFPDLKLFVDTDPDGFRQWYQKNLNRIYLGYGPLLAGVVLAVVIELSVGSTINAFAGANLSLLYFRTAYRLLAFLILGSCLWSLVSVMLLPNQLLKLNVNIRINGLAGIGLQALGNAFFKMALSTAACFTILVCLIMVSPLSGDRVVLSWAVAGSVIIFGFFILPQLGIHRIMAHEKKQQLIAFSRHLEEALGSSLKNPSGENMERLKDLFEVQKHLNDVSEWPFNTTALWQLISALLIPFLLVIIQMLLKV